MAELASGLAANRLTAAADRLSAADKPDATGVTSSTRAGLRNDVQRRGSEFIAVSGGASTLNGTRSGAAAPSAEQSAAARQQLLDFVRANGTADQAKQAEALFRGEANTDGTSASGSGATAGRTNGTSANATPGNVASATTAPSPSASSPEVRERLDRDREALSRLTQLNASLRQGQAFGNAGRGSVINFFT